MSEIDPSINYDNRTPEAGEKDRSVTLTTAYQLVFPANGARIGYEFEGAIAVAGTISLRYGTGSTVYEIVGGGSHARGPANTGGVWTGEIYAKSSVNADKLIAREW